MVSTTTSSEVMSASAGKSRLATTFLKMAIFLSSKKAAVYPGPVRMSVSSRYSAPVSVSRAILNSMAAVSYDSESSESSEVTVWSVTSASASASLAASS